LINLPIRRKKGAGGDFEKVAALPDAGIFENNPADQYGLNRKIVRPSVKYTLVIKPGTRSCQDKITPKRQVNITKSN
jgi:hypothetical protein